MRRLLYQLALIKQEVVAVTVAIVVIAATQVKE